VNESFVLFFKKERNESASPSKGQQIRPFIQDRAGETSRGADRLRSA
jgi:hypothetical protein